MPNNKPKMIRELYTMLTERYTPNEIAMGGSLLSLFQYLQRKMSTLDGNYITYPSEYIRNIIKLHLGYEFPKPDKIYVK